MPQKTCSAMTSLHHSPSTAKGMSPSKAGNWTSKTMQRAYLDKLCLKLVETEAGAQEAFAAKLEQSGSTTSSSSSAKANPTAAKLSECLTQQDDMTDSCPLYLLPSADDENAHIRWLS